MLETKIEELRKKVSEWKRDGLKVGLVPTMGALHEGHLSLIKKSVEICDKTVVSVFVNPIQFGPSEDLEKYPRNIEADLELCKKAGGDKCEIIVFAPTPAEMYPDANIMSNDFLTYIAPPFFYSNKLCGKSRVGHFDGVCTVVMKLFNIVQPDSAFFGQKDAQQLIIIKKMVKDLNVPVEIVACPIVRDGQGLALSSRNKYLSEDGRREALVLSKILSNIKACYNKGIMDVNALCETAFSFLNEHHQLEYLEFVDRETLENKTVADSDTLVLIALRVDNVRLIDNCFIN
ncbi:MAG: pantoate--beta-alanine ligase [Candidatus Gastranaerophilaceae bacterium]